MTPPERSPLRGRRNASAAVAGAAAAAILMLLAVLLLDQAPAALVELLFPVAVGVATYYAGPRVAAFYLVVPLATFVARGFSVNAAVLVAACALVYIFTAAALTNARRLRLSEARLRALLGSISDHIYVIGHDATADEVSPANPLPPHPARDGDRKRRIDDFLPPEIAGTALQHVQRALELRDTVQLEYSTTSDGEVTWYSASVTPMSDDSVVWVARDVTVRKNAEEALKELNTELETRVEERTRELSASVAALHAEALRRGTAEAALRQSEDQYRSIIDQVNDVIFSLDRHGTLTMLNPAFDRSFGVSRFEWIGRSFFDMVAEEERNAARALLERALQAERDEAMPVVLCRPDGGRVIVEVALAPQTIHGHVIGFIGVARDITERNRAEKQLRESEERFRLLSRATNDAVWEWNPVTDEMWWSDGYLTLFGYLPERSPMGASSLRIHPEDRDRVIDGLQSALESTATVWSDEYRYRRADGTFAIVFDRGYIMRNESGRAQRMTGAMMDVTERRQLQEQLAQANRVSSLGRVAASIAHEFNNVLMGIMPNVELLRQSRSEETRESIDFIVRAVQRGKRVTEQILRFTRTTPPELRSVDVGEFLATWEHEARPLLGDRVHLQIDAESRLHMRADPMQMSQVLTNLAVNARDAIGTRRGELRIVAVGAPQKNLVCIRVTDTGSGIDDELLPRIFEPLFTTKRSGTGLGLAISYQIVAQHGGRLEVESRRGSGTTFTIYLPAAPPASSYGPAEAPAPFSARRVLIVEDEPAVAFGMGTLLEMEGAVVEVATTGADAVNVFARFGPDCLIVDIGLPDMSGVDVVRKLEAIRPGVPTLFSSGHADEAKLGEFAGRANVSLLLKPYSFETLRAAIAVIMQHA